MRGSPRPAASSPAPRRRRRRRLAQLPGWSRSAEELQRLAVPLDATVDLYESRLSEASREQQAIAERLAAEDDAIRQLETQLQSMDLQHDVPTEEVLLAARNRREQGWRLVKFRLARQGARRARPRRVPGRVRAGGTLAAAYEQSVRRGDTRPIACDARRTASPARRNGWPSSTSIEAGDGRSNRRAVASMSAGPASTGTGRPWSIPWVSRPRRRTPVELRAWLRRRDEVVLLFEKAEEARQGVEPLKDALDMQREAVTAPWTRSANRLRSRRSTWPSSLIRPRPRSRAKTT